jgi:predicted nucleic acid-binding protein
MIFVDTGAWFARFVAKDPQHVTVTAWFASNEEPLLTSDYCVDETLTLLAARNRPIAPVEAGRELLNETICRLHFLSPPQFHRAWILFEQRAAAGWSFTDCTSKVVIDELGLTSAFTLDQHFQQFGIQVLP